MFRYGSDYARATYLDPKTKKRKQIWRKVGDQDWDETCREVRRAVEKALNPPPEQEWIYLLHAQGSPFFKIGITRNLNRRTIALQNACPYTLEFVMKIMGDVSVEAAIHQRLKRYHVRGEWFAFDDLLIPVDVMQEFVPQKQIEEALRTPENYTEVVPVRVPRRSFAEILAYS